jgi:hypothetical protein
MITLKLAFSACVKANLCDTSLFFIFIMVFSVSFYELSLVFPIYFYCSIHDLGTFVCYCHRW